MQFCLDKDAKCPENSQLLDVISSTEKKYSIHPFCIGTKHILVSERPNILNVIIGLFYKIVESGIFKSKHFSNCLFI